MSIPVSREARPCVLVVVADPLSRELLQQNLHLSGFASVAAATGERALLQLRESRQAVDWLVTSPHLPGLVDGSILADEFQALHPARTALFLRESSAAAAADVVAQLRALVDASRPVEKAAETEANHALAA